MSWLDLNLRYKKKKLLIVHMTLVLENISVYMRTQEFQMPQTSMPGQWVNSPEFHHIIFHIMCIFLMYMGRQTKHFLLRLMSSRCILKNSDYRLLVQSYDKNSIFHFNFER